MQVSVGGGADEVPSFCLPPHFHAQSPHSIEESDTSSVENLIFISEGTI